MPELSQGHKYPLFETTDMSLAGVLIEAICDQRHQLPLLLALVIVMGLLLVFPFLFLEPGHAAYSIAIVDAVLIGGSILLFGGIYWYCTKRAMD